MTWGCSGVVLKKELDGAADAECAKAAIDSGGADAVRRSSASDMAAIAPHGRAGARQGAGGECDKGPCPDAELREAVIASGETASSAPLAT